MSITRNQSKEFETPYTHYQSSNQIIEQEQARYANNKSKPNKIEQGFKMLNSGWSSKQLELSNLNQFPRRGKTTYDLSKIIFLFQITLEEHLFYKII